VTSTNAVVHIQIHTIIRNTDITFRGTKASSIK